MAASSTIGAQRRRPRAPGVLYIVLSIALVIVIGAVALTARQPPPPSIAEFAPQAVEQIKEAPSEQSSDFGAAGGGGGGSSQGGLGAGAPPPPEVIDVPRVRKCVGNPPRQIEDPQSPPCVPYWSGDNGGATWKGVTRDEVRIYLATGDGASDIYPQLELFFNKRFEFYGRKLRFIRGRGDIGRPDPANQRADAVAADEQNVFASTFYRNSDGLYYRAELARRGVISVGVYMPNDHAFLAASRPYMWQYAMEADRIFANTGEWACKRIVGGNAVHAGQDSLTSKRRVFAIVMQPFFEEDLTDSTQLENELSLCGERARVKLRNPVRGDPSGRPSPASVDPVSANNAILQIKDAGATSIFCLCNLFAVGALMKAATNQAYFPEWLLSSYGAMDINNSYTVGAAPPEQTDHAFGLVFIPRQVKVEKEPYWWAIKEIDPSGAYSNNTVDIVARNEEYRTILLLASGIQMAGPKLTAFTFEQALHRTKFPNPAHPIMAGKVGFLGGSYGMTIDGAEFWWSNNTLGPYEGDDNGTLCYLNGGGRYSKGSWLAGPGQFFQGACDAG